MVLLIYTNKSAFWKAPNGGAISRNWCVTDTLRTQGAQYTSLHNKKCLLERRAHCKKGFTFFNSNVACTGADLGVCTMRFRDKLSLLDLFLETCFDNKQTCRKSSSLAKLDIRHIMLVIYRSNYGEHHGLERLYVAFIKNHPA